MKGPPFSKWSAGARSETGYVRTENQDRMSRVRFATGIGYIVSDGMGGHRGGAAAAEVTVRILGKHVASIENTESIQQALRHAFAEANRCVYEMGHAGDPERAGMGATAVVCVTVGPSVLVANIGDSRAYLYRDGRLQQLTRDHTRAQQMIDAGVLSEDQAREHPDARVLVRAVGRDLTIEPDVGTWVPIKEGDAILLCSDGMYVDVADAEIEEALGHEGGAQTLADRLTGLALEKGGSDNVTVQLICYGERPTPFEWRSFGGQLAMLPVVTVVCAAVGYMVGSSLQEPARQRLWLLETETRRWKDEVDRSNTKMQDDVRTMKTRLDSLNARLDASMQAGAPASFRPGAPASNARRP